MHEFLQRDIEYVVRVEEILWGCVLLGVTLIVHGAALFHILRMSASLISWPRASLPGFGTAVFIATVLSIVVLHLTEVLLWAVFFTWKDAQPNLSSAFYNALVNYTTLGAGYLPIRWRLLEGVLGMGGLLCFAFSTSALLALGQQVVHLPFMDKRTASERSNPADAKSNRE